MCIDIDFNFSFYAGNGVTKVDKDNVYNYTTPHKTEVIKGLIQALQIDR